MLSCEVCLCCPSICSGNYLLGCAPWTRELADWLILSHSRCRAAQLSHANLCLLPSLLSHLQSGLLQLSKLMLPVCKKHLMKLGLQSCKIVLWKICKESPPLTGPELGSETKMLSCQQQMVNVCKNAALPGILIF